MTKSSDWMDLIYKPPGDAAARGEEVVPADPVIEDPVIRDDALEEPTPAEIEEVRHVREVRIRSDLLVLKEAPAEIEASVPEEIEETEEPEQTEPEDRIEDQELRDEEPEAQEAQEIVLDEDIQPDDRALGQEPYRQAMIVMESGRVAAFDVRIPSCDGPSEEERAYAWVPWWDRKKLRTARKKGMRELPKPSKG